MGHLIDGIAGIYALHRLQHRATTHDKKSHWFLKVPFMNEGAGLCAREVYAHVYTTEGGDHAGKLSKTILL